MKQLDEKVTKLAGFENYYSVSGQTYSRKVDIEVLNVLGSLGATLHKVNFVNISYANKIKSNTYNIRTCFF